MLSHSAANRTTPHPLVKPETLRLMQYYKAKFNSRVDSLITRSIHSQSKMESISMDRDKSIGGDYQAGEAATPTILTTA